MYQPLKLLAASVAVLVAVGCGDETLTAPEIEPDFLRSPSLALNRPTEVAVIGDVPYSEAELEIFPRLARMINAETGVRSTVHVGDIKQQGSSCTDEWFLSIRKHFGLFKNPLVYTPGDNEWTDCHKPNAGNWNPLERLKTIRKVFFPRPGVSLGAQPMRVKYQSGYPENQMWLESGVVFTAIHEVGSNNNLDPWTCFEPFTAECPVGNLPESAAMTEARLREFRARDSANRGWLNAAFSLARELNAKGVVILVQADFWSGAIVNGTASSTGHRSFVRLLARHAAAFQRPVLLFGGDTHNFKVRQPLVGDVVYGAVDAPNLTNIIVDRSIEPETGGGFEYAWVRLGIDPQSDAVFKWENVTTIIP